jgi:hypothetical protein
VAMINENALRLPSVFRYEGTILHAAPFDFVGSPHEDESRSMTDAEFARYAERRERGEYPSWTYSVE